MSDRYAAIHAHRGEYPVRLMCDVLGVSASGYYAAQRRPPGTRAAADERVRVAVRAAHAKSQRRYGAPRVHRALRAAGTRVAKKRVARLMREDGLVARRARPPPPPPTPPPPPPGAPRGGARGQHPDRGDDLDMPALPVRRRGHGGEQALEQAILGAAHRAVEVDPQAAHALPGHRGKLVRRGGRRVDHRHAAATAAEGIQRAQQHAVVGAVEAGLHDHEAPDPQRGGHPLQVRQRGRGCGVGAIFGLRFRCPDDVDVGGRMIVRVYREAAAPDRCASDRERANSMAPIGRPNTWACTVRSRQAGRGASSAQPSRMRARVRV